MQISKPAVVLALHEIFDRYQIFSGGSLALITVEDAWKTSGLRKSDLDEGIVQLIREGHLAVEMTSGGPAVKLLSYSLPKGEADQPSPRSVVDRVRSRRRGAEPEIDRREGPASDS